MGQRGKAKIWLTPSFRCYLFKFRFHGQLIFSLNRRPQAGLIFDESGALYGTTFSGGTGCAPLGCGTVFKLAPPATDGGIWTLDVLHYFTGDDGASPVGSLIFDKTGALYGTTRFGGAG